MLNLLSNPAVIGLTALFLAVVWMLRNEKDRTRPLLVIALVVNLFYGWLLTFVMGRENGLVPWKFDYVLAGLDQSLGLGTAPIAAMLHHWERIPLLVIYQLMVPMMIAWFMVARSRNLSGGLVLAYVAEMVVGPALYALMPGCGPVYAFRGQWLHPPAVAAVPIRLAGMPNAFPSLHIGTALVLVLFSGGRWSRCFALAFLACTALATLSTGEHYVIDLVPGLAFGCFAASVGLRRWVSSLSFFAVVLGWSLGARFGYGFLIAHPGWLRFFAAMTVAAAVATVARMWAKAPGWQAAGSDVGQDAGVAAG